MKKAKICSGPILLMLVYAGACLAAVVPYSKNNDYGGQLKGRWSPDCENFDGIRIDSRLDAEFTINSNQIVIDSKLVGGDQQNGVFGVYLVAPLDLGPGGMKLEWGNFSRISKIAEVKINGENNFRLKWVGFFNKHMNQYQWVSQPDFYRGAVDIEFYRCAD